MDRPGGCSDFQPEQHKGYFGYFRNFSSSHNTPNTNIESDDFSDI